jgi:hypothetical protein
MKPAITALLAVALGVALTGCAANKAIDNIGAISEDTATAQLACYAALEAEAKTELAAMDKIPPEDVTNYLMMRMVTQNSLAMVSVATGRSADRCGGTNVYDFLARATEAEYKMIASLGGGLFRLATWWAVAHEVAGFGETLAESKGISIDGSSNIKLDNTANHLSAGKDSTYLSGESASMNKVDNDVVQNNAAADATGDNVNVPNSQPTETPVDIQELEVIE